jgi:ComF family protein
LKHGIDLLYPRNCLICSTSLQENETGVICAKCLATAKPIEPPFCDRCALPFDGKLDDPFVCGYCAELKFHFRRTVSACRAEGIVRESIHRFKYNREMYFGAHLASWLIDAAARRIDWRDIDAIVPVPLFPRKQRAREFNQAEFLARALSRAIGVAVISGSLRRVKETVTQTALNAKQRAANLRGAFAVKTPGAFAGKRLALVDDVFTTGATLDSCAKVLLQSGAREVMALTVARGV